MDAEPGPEPEAEPDAEPGAERDAGTGGNAATERGRHLDHGQPTAATDTDDTHLPVAKPAVSPGAPPRPTTRSYSDVSDDDRDVGWGDRSAPSGRDDDWYLRERPPHHG